MDKKRLIYVAIFKSQYGLNITEIEKETKLKRSFIRTELAFLLGQEKIIERKLGMSKIYFIK